MRVPNPFRLPSPLKLAVLDLEGAQRDLLAHTKLAEYHRAMTAMLGERIKRLQKDVKDLSKDREAQA